MTNLLYICLVLLGLAIGKEANAIEPDKALHFGAGAIATGASYAWCRGAFRMNEWDSRLFSFVAGTVINSVGEMMDEKPEFNDWLAGQLGVGAFITTTIVFDF